MASALARAWPAAAGFVAGVVAMQLLGPGSDAPDASLPELHAPPAEAPATGQPPAALAAEAGDAVPSVPTDDATPADLAHEVAAADPAHDATAADTRWELLGTAAAGDTGRARAIVRDVESGETRDLAVGQRLGEAEVVEIAGRRVLLRDPNGGLWTLRDATVESRPAKDDAATVGDGIVDPGASLAAHLAAASDAEAEALRQRLGGDLLAHYEDGRLVGWLVAPAAEAGDASLIATAQLRTGDRVLALNGFDLTRPETLAFLATTPLPFDAWIFRVVDLEGGERLAVEALEAPAGP